MPSKSPRVNVSLECEAVDMLNQIAKEEHISLSKLVRELTLEADTGCKMRSIRS
jgi:predicted DNA-binding ribbon-helix-helix protein